MGDPHPSTSEMAPSKNKLSGLTLRSLPTHSPSFQMLTTIFGLGNINRLVFSKPLTNSSFLRDKSPLIPEALAVKKGVKSVSMLFSKMFVTPKGFILIRRTCGVRSSVAADDLSPVGPLLPHPLPTNSDAMSSRWTIPARRKRYLYPAWRDTQRCHPTPFLPPLAKPDGVLLRWVHLCLTRLLKRFD